MFRNPKPQELVEFMIAARGGDEETVKKFICNYPGALDFTDTRYSSEPITASGWAVAYNRSNIVRLLLDAGACVNTTYANTDTLLMRAAQNGFDAIVNDLIKAGADIDVCNRKHNTALLLAALYGRSGSISILLTAGANVNGNNVNGNKVCWGTRTSATLTPLMCAATYGHTAAVKILLSNPNIKVNLTLGHYGEPAFSQAVLGGHVDTVKAILTDPNLDVNTDVTPMNSALINAILRGNYQMVNALLTSPVIEVNVVHQDDHCETDGYTALVLAAHLGHAEIVKSLLAHRKINVNGTDKKRNTALIVTAKTGNIHILNLLLADPRIDLEANNAYYQTAASIAQLHDHREVYDCIMRAIRIKHVKSEIEQIKILYTNCNTENDPVDILRNLSKIKTKKTSLLKMIRIDSSLNSYKEVLTQLINKDNNGMLDVLKSVKSELVRETDTQWKVKSIFYNWVNGTPRHITQLNYLFNHFNENDMDNIIETYAKVKKSLIETRDIPSKNRHPETYQFYSRLQAILGLNPAPTYTDNALMMSPVPFIPTSPLIPSYIPDTPTVQPDLSITRPTGQFQHLQSLLAENTSSDLTSPSSASAAPTSATQRLTHSPLIMFPPVPTHTVSTPDAAAMSANANQSAPSTSKNRPTVAQ